MRFLWVFFFVWVYGGASLSEIQIGTPHAVLINAKTGKILFEKKCREPIHPASTTKIATALYLFKKNPGSLEEKTVCTKEALKMIDEKVKEEKSYDMPAYWLEPDGSTIYLKNREEVFIKDLLHGALLSSGNDACNVLAQYFFSDIQLFVDQLNEMAKELGCLGTNFCNPHGLYHPKHVSTAYDMAILAKEAWQYPQFREIVQMMTYRALGGSRKRKREFLQKNALLQATSKFYYPRAIGIKIGYTRKSKFSLIAAASDGNRELIVALHKNDSSSQGYLDAIALFEEAFSEALTKRLLFRKEETTFTRKLFSAKSPLIGVLRNDFYLEHYPSEEEEIETKLCWEDPLILPIEKGAVVGYLKVFSKERGEEMAREQILAKKRVEKRASYFLIDQVREMFSVFSREAKS